MIKTTNEEQDTEGRLNMHTIEYYIAFKKKEILSHAMPCMNLKDIKLSKSSQ